MVHSIQRKGLSRRGRRDKGGKGGICRRWIGRGGGRASTWVVESVVQEEVGEEGKGEGETRLKWLRRTVSQQV
jgi:hypothetical protein